MPRPAGRQFVAAALGTAGVVILLGAAFFASAPLWIRLEPVQRKIESAASSALGGPVRFGRIDFSWFPRPEVVIRQAEVSAPGKVSGTVLSVSVRPAFLPLLRGHVRFSSLSADGPDLKIFLADREGGAGSAPASDPLEGLAPLLGSLAAQVPGLAVDVTGGRAAFVRRGKIVITVREIESHASFSQKELRLDFRCTSDFVALPAGGVMITGGAGGRVAGVFAWQGRTFHASVTASAPSVSFRRPNRRALEIRGLDVEGAFDLGNGRTGLRISRLSLTSPRLQVEGAYNADSGLARAEVNATGSGLDVTRLREKLLSFAGDVPTVPAIFAILRGGTLRSFSFAAAGRTPDELGIFDRMSIRGTLADGAVHLEGPGLDLEDARADVSVERGLLSAEHAAARLGNSRAWDGSVRVGLGKNDRRLRVEARAQADLAELVPVLSRALAPGAFPEELSLVEDLSGSAVGRVTIGNRVGALKTNVQVSEVRLSARYRRIPWPIRIHDGAFLYDGQRIEVSRLRGNVGGSTLSGLSATVRLEDPALFEDLSGTVETPLGELFPWLVSRPGMEALEKNVRKLEGSLALSVDRVSGPVARPLDLRGDATVRLRNIVAEIPALREPLEIESGDFRLGLTGGGALSLAGTSTLRDGPHIALDLGRDAEGTNVRDLTINDAGSVASVALDLRREAAGFSFKGRLLAATLDRFLPGRQPRPGWIEGDLRALVPERDLRQATADGTLEAADVDVPTPVGPVTIERLRLEASGSRFDVTSSAALDQQRMSISGAATLRGDGIALDMDVSAGDVAWEDVDRVLNRLNKEGEGGKAAAAGPPSPRPPSLGVRGDLRLSVDSFTFGNLTWKDIQAGVKLEKASVVADLRKAEVCGISTTGGFRFLPEGTIQVDAGAASAGPDIRAPLTCLGIENAPTGRYEMSARVHGGGQASDLPRAACGDATLKVWKGGFGKAGLLTKIMRTLRAANVFSGKQDVFEKSRTFDELSARGEMADGTLSIREASLKMPSLTMVGSGTLGYVDRSLDLVVLAYPLSTVDKVIQAVPVIRYIAGKTFLSVAVKVTGSFEDPKIGLSPGRDVGQGLVNMLARTVKLPVEVFTPSKE